MAGSRHASDDGVDALTAADQEQALSSEDLELLGVAAWWAGRPDEASEALDEVRAERARESDLRSRRTR
jgi:hypothetical protein